VWTDIKVPGCGRDVTSNFFRFFQGHLEFSHCNDLEISDFSVKQHLAIIFFKYFFLSDNTSVGAETF